MFEGGRGIPLEDITFRAEAKKEASLNSRELLATLNPEVVKDENGIARTIFTFQNKRGKNIRVLFYEKGDLPMIGNSLDERQAFVFGDRPKRRSDKDWEGFVKQAKDHSAMGQEAVNPGIIRSEVIDDGKALFFVEQNPKALLDMAIMLGADNKELRESRLLWSKGETNDQLEKMMDQVIAAKILNDDGSLKDVADHEGEALLMRALTGDKLADGILAKKLAQLKEKDEARKEAVLAENRESLAKETIEPLNPKELVAVHMTNWMPRRDRQNMSWELQTTYEATGRQNPRITQHFTMNHPVVSAGLYGSWEGTSMGLIIPFDKLVEANGKPTALNTIDTFWERSPGRKMRLPQENTFLVKPGEVKEDGKLSEKQGHVITYKDRGFTPQDVRLIAQEIGEEEVGWGLQQKIMKGLEKAFIEYSVAENRVISKIPPEDFAKFAPVLGGRPEDPPDWVFADQMGKRRDMVKDLLGKSIREVVNDLLDEAGIRDRVDGKIIDEAVKGIEGAIIFYIKDITIKKQIRDMGYEVHGGGMWAWDGDSWDATAKTRKLGVEMGVPVLPHSAHPSANVETVLSNRLYELEHKEITPVEFRMAMQAITRPDYLAKLSQPMRQMLYEVGAL